MNTSHKRHRRGVSSPGTEFLFLSKNEQILNQSAIVATDQRSQLASGAASAAAKNERDQFNFTFFKEKSSTPGLANENG